MVACWTVSCEKERALIAGELNWTLESIEIELISNSPGPGNAVMVEEAGSKFYFGDVWNFVCFPLN